VRVAVPTEAGTALDRPTVHEGTSALPPMRLSGTLGLIGLIGLIGLVGLV
jgi:hypothetical protein